MPGESMGHPLARFRAARVGRQDTDARSVDPVTPDRPRLVVHIGSHRAGSTSIQAYLRANGPTLARQGIVYPADKLPAYPEQHSYLATLLKADDIDAVDGFLSSVSTEAMASSARTVVLSGE